MNENTTVNHFVVIYRAACLNSLNPINPCNLFYKEHILNIIDLMLKVIDGSHKKDVKRIDNNYSLTKYENLKINFKEKVPLNY